MSFAVDLSNELHLKNIEDEARLKIQQNPEPPQEELQEPKFIFFDTPDLVNKSTSNDNENARQLILQLSSHTSGIAMEKSEGSEEDLY